MAARGRRWPNTWRTRILRALAAGPCSANDLRIYLGPTWRTLHGTLNRMQEDGEIRRIAYGVYCCEERQP
jgi:DNA-binding HxlR family transcriptional regulator